MTSPFEIKILRAGSTAPDPAADPMLGGALRVTINGVVVADDDEFGLERSALGLLRTLDRDHDEVHQVGFPTLLIHDCGFPFDACSNFLVDWAVRHDGGDVMIADARSASSHPVIRDLAFPGAACRMPLPAYRAPIVAFAASVRDKYFSAGEKRLEEWERPLDDELWREYDELLARHLDAREHEQRTR